MLGPFDYAIWVVGFLVEIGVVVCIVYRKELSRYLPLTIYMFAVALVNCGQYWCIERFGFTSQQYFYCYYYTESLLIILLFWTIIQFYQQTFREMNVSGYIRGGAVLLLLATSLFSYIVVHENRNHLTTRFVVELGQNLHFVGMVLTYLLWGAILKLRETRTRLIQFVLALGVYFSATACTYALRNLFPGLQPSVLRWVPPIMGVWLPIAWAYTFAKVSEDSRLATARLVARAR
jgi:Na+/citrate or Na+/malate symporter